MARTKRQAPKKPEDDGRTIASLTAIAPASGSPSPWSPPALDHTGPSSLLPMRLAIPEPRSGENERVTASTPISSDEPFDKIAARRPEDVARVIQALLSPGDTNGDPDSDTGIRKAATLVIGLGPRLAASVLKHCTPGEAVRIGRAVWSTEAITARDAQDVFEEARENLISGNYNLEGGVGFARELLARTLGAREARHAIDRLKETDATGEGIRMLSNLEPDQIVPFISKEHPQTTALVLSQMDPMWAARVLNAFPVTLRSEVVARIGELDTISATVLYELEHSIEADMAALFSRQTRQVGGPEVAANVLSHLDETSRADVLKALEEEGGDVSAKVREAISRVQSREENTAGEPSDEEPS